MKMFSFFFYFSDLYRRFLNGVGKNVMIEILTSVYTNWTVTTSIRIFISYVILFTSIFIENVFVFFYGTTLIIKTLY